MRQHAHNARMDEQWTFRISGVMDEKLDHRCKMLAIDELDVATLILAGSCGMKRIRTIECDPPLPKDVKYRGLWHDPSRRGWYLLLYHESFEKVDWGTQAPEIQTTYRIVELKPETNPYE